jgi:AbrB family looped-hinge helix DNA binding protein
VLLLVAQEIVSMNAVILTVSANGRVVIPDRIRTELGLRSGEKVVARICDGALVLEPVGVAIKRAQALIRRCAALTSQSRGRAIGGAAAGSGGRVPLKADWLDFRRWGGYQL